MSPSRQEGSRTGQDRRDNAGGPRDDAGRFNTRAHPSFPHHRADPGPLATVPGEKGSIQSL